MRSLKDNRVPFIITQPEPYRGYTILDIQYWIYRGYTDTGYTGCMRILYIYCVLIKLERYPFV